MTHFNKDIAHNQLPGLPPNADLESKAILSKVIKASRALAHLNGALSNLPNPTLFLDTIHLQEAKLSSEIENIITTSDDLFQSAIAEKNLTNPAIKEVLHYKKALWLGFEELKSRPFITTNLCIRIVRCIKQNSSSIRKTPGTALQTIQGETIYTPPNGEDLIREKMANLENFINNENSIDPLIKLAVMHYQFEAIHPFEDGNGRTGRILLLLYLKMTDLLNVPALYLSEYILQNKSEYYKLLQGVTENGEWEDFILYMLDMIETSARQALSKVDEITAAMTEYATQIKEHLPKVYSKDLIELMFHLPYIKRKTLIEAGLGTPKTVGNYLIELEQAGFLSSKKVGKEKLYLNEALMGILT